MMKMVMKQQYVASLPELVTEAQDQGSKMVACTMSMMSCFSKEDLIDDLEFAGVAS